jgi:hypothetical protein
MACGATKQQHNSSVVLQGVLLQELAQMPLKFT